MSSVILTGDTSGTLTVSAPLVAGSNTLTLAPATGTLSPLVSATAVASTSGTSIDFTGIPTYAKRITVMFSGVSTSGTSNITLRIGSGSIQTSGYVGAALSIQGGSTSSATNANSSSFLLTGNINTAADLLNGNVQLCLISGNTWIESGNISNSLGSRVSCSGGNVTLSGTLDLVRITTVNGTDTFDAGSINIMYEG
jgi:hypothetical protein